MNTAIIIVSESALPLARIISKELGNCQLLSTHSLQDVQQIPNIQAGMKFGFEQCSQIVFMGALGICVRSMAECIRNKYKDPAVVCLDSKGDFVIPVLSGHIGGANKLAQRIGTEEAVHYARDGLGIDQLSRSKHLIVTHVHALTDGTGHTSQTNGELVAQLLTYRTYTTV